MTATEPTLADIHQALLRLEDGYRRISDQFRAGDPAHVEVTEVRTADGAQIGPITWTETRRTRK